MRKLILQEFVSLDGFAADAQGTTQFFEQKGDFSKDIDEDLLQFIKSIDTILLGANTYRMFVDFWPTATTDQEIVVDELNKRPKLVFSNSLKTVQWGKWDNASVVSGDAATAVRKLKQQPGKDMVLWGSLSLAQSLIQAGVIDEVQLRVLPKALGAGKPLFTAPMNLKLKDTRTYDSGVVYMALEARK